MRAIKERIFTFSLPFPLRLTSFLDVPGTKKETVKNELQEMSLLLKKILIESFEVKYALRF